jgi:hypothetical protein
MEGEICCYSFTLAITHWFFFRLSEEGNSKECSNTCKYLTQSWRNLRRTSPIRICRWAALIWAIWASSLLNRQRQTVRSRIRRVLLLKHSSGSIWQSTQDVSWRFSRSWVSRIGKLLKWKWWRLVSLGTVSMNAVLRNQARTRKWRWSWL